MPGVPLGVLDVEPRPLAGETVEDRRRLVGRGVVDDDHLDAVEERHDVALEVAHERLDRARLVVDRHHDRQVHYRPHLVIVVPIFPFDQTGRPLGAPS